MIEFHLDPRSGVSPYMQIVQQVRHALRLGLLGEGDQLPTVKEVVAVLAINPNTVLKAYRDLEREGLVRPRPGLGTFVVGRLTSTDPEALARFRTSMTKLVRSARGAGLSDEEIEAIYRSAVRDAYDVGEGVA